MDTLHYGEISSSLSQTSSLWIWELLEILGAVIVTLGVVGEYVAGFTKILKGRSKQKRWEKYSTLVLIVGLVFELIGLVTTLVLSNQEIEQLRSANLKLQQQLLPRRISLEQKERFVNYLANYPKGPVKVFIGRQDDELLDYTKHIRAILDAAGYAVTNGPGIIPLGENTGIYRPIGDDLGPKISVFVIFSATNNLSISWPGIEFQHNGNHIVTKSNPNDPRAIPAFINAALGRIGVPTTFVSCQGVLSEGDWGVYVRQKF